MLDFKAYFYDEQVCVDGSVYKSNETLTACLNLPQAELNSCLVRLWRLFPRAQLHGGSAEQLRDFLRCIQQAQELFLRLGRLSAQLPLFSGELGHNLTQPHLLCQVDMLCTAGNIPSQKIDDSSSVIDIYFLPIASTLAQLSGPEAADELTALNLGTAELFGQYIRLAEDLLQASHAYSSFLDGYIHQKRSFPSCTELAGQFARCSSDMAHKAGYEKLPSFCRVPSSYELCLSADGTERLCLTCRFERLRDFLYLDFFRGLERCFIPRRCDNCGKYFLLTGGKYSSYCERPLPGEPEKTCRSIGAKKRYGSKCRNDPVWVIYNRAYKTHYARYMKGKMTAPEFESWSRYAVSLREQAAGGSLGAEQYERLIRE